MCEHGDRSKAILILKDPARRLVMANCQLPPPDVMVCTGNVATNWKIFKEAYNDFATATELTNKDDEIQAATLKTVMGKECRQILSRLELTRKSRIKSSRS